MDSLTIYHHGVKGQKWGVRRTPAQLGHKISKSIRKRSKVKAEVKNTQPAKPKSKSISEMSDQEIRDRIERLRLEKSLRDLTPKTTSRGRSVVNTIAKDMALPAAKEIGTQLVKSGMAKLLNDTLNLSGTEYKIYTNNEKKKK